MRFLSFSKSLISTAAFLSAFSLCAKAADEPGSLNSIWLDQGTEKSSDKAADKATKNATETPVKPEESPKQESAAPAADTSAAESTSSEKALAPDTLKSTAATETNAPLCTIGSFKNSSLVTKGGWPGIGPFQSSESNSSELQDESKNALKLETQGDSIVKAELSINKKQPHPDENRELLELEINIDFLLEAVGIKPKGIIKFNHQFEGYKNALAYADINPIHINAGRNMIILRKDRESASSSAFTYVISVNSLDANKTILQQHSTAEIKPEPVKEVPPQTSSENNTAQSDKLKDEFATILKNWQVTKKAAVRQRQTDDLSSVLSGKALVRQSDAIKWLISNHKYYEMNPKGVIISKYTEVVPGKKYIVFAQVREVSKFIDEATQQVLKETDDTYKVNYTLEKVDDRWFISDSQLLSHANLRENNKSANKVSHQ